MTITFSLASAASTDNPSLMILREKGFGLLVKCSRQADGRVKCIYIAQKEGLRFAANSGAELLGLVALWEFYGEEWNRQEPDILDEVVVNEDDQDASDSLVFLK